MNLASLPLASSGDGVELLRAAAVLHKLKGTTDAVRPSSSSDTYGRHVVPGAVWSRIALYSKNPREIRQVLTAVSPSVRLALTPVSVSSTRSVSSGGFDAHDTPGQRPYTPSLHTATTPSTPRSPPPGLHLPHAGLSCDALRVHRWWLWGLGSFPLNLDVPLGTITSTVADGAAGGGGNNAVPQLDLNEGGGQWTPASIRSTTTPAQYITTSPLMLLGSGRTNSSSQVPLNRVAPNTAGTITEDVWREHHRTTTGGRTTTAPENQRAVSAAAAPVTTGVSASGGGGFDMFPSAPLDPVSLAFPFYEEHWDDCHVRAIHIRLLQDDHQQNNVVRQQQLQLPQQQRPGLGQSAVMHKLSVRRELDICHRVAGCLAHVPHLENFALTLVPRRQLHTGPQPSMVHGYYNPLANPLRATTPGSLQHYPNANSPLVRPQATPLTSPMLGAQPVPPLSVGASIVPSSASVAAWMNTTSLLLAPVSLVPLAQRFAPHLTTMSISNARIVATSEAVGDDIFPIGATEEDIEAYRTIKEIQEEHARKLREEAEAKAAAAKAAAEEKEAAIAAAAAAKATEGGSGSATPSSGSGATPTTSKPSDAEKPKLQQQQVSHPFRAPSYATPTTVAKSRSTEQLASFPSGAATDSPTTPDAPALPPRRRGGEDLLPAAVQRLRLVDCVIDAAALRRLAELKDLEHLVFMGCTFPTTTGIDGIEVLASACPKLQHLVLCSCDVRNVSPLALLSQLRTIDLSGNPLLEDISPLSHLKDLEEINLNGCSLHTVAPLAACGSLWKLEVAGNPLGAPLTASAGGGLLVNGGRSMGSSMPSLHGMAAGSSSSSASTTAVANNNGPVSCGGLELLTRLQFLDAENCGLVNIFALTTLSALRYLSLARNRIRHNDYARLPPEFSFSFPFLEHLDLSRTTLAFLRHFEGLQRLRVLRIDDNLLAHHAFPQHLAVLPELRVLHADNCGLDDLRRLPEICPKLERLYASKNKQLTDDRMPAFSSMLDLRCIHLRACSLTAARFFQNCSQLREVDISDNTLTRSGAAELSDTSPSLEVLLIGNCGIKDTTFLKDLVHLKRVDLRGNVLNAALPMHFMMLDSHAHTHAQQQAAAQNPPHRGGGSLSNANTPGSLSNRSFQRVYSGAPCGGTLGGDDDAAEIRGGAAFSRSSSTLLRSPHIGPSAASPSRMIMKQAHLDPLAWI